jgi:hypothetical protein
VGQAQHVAVGHALAVAVLDRLVGQQLDRAIRVPGADRTPQRPAPAAPRRGERDEREQVRRGAAHLRQDGERGPAGGRVGGRGATGERIHRRVVLGGPAGLRDRDDLGDRAGAVERDALVERRRALRRQVELAGVERAALRAEDQEAPKPHPRIDREDVAALGVRDLVRAQLLALAGRPPDDTGEIGHRNLLSKGSSEE